MFNVHIHRRGAGRILKKLGVIMATQEELANELDAVKQQVGKIGGETGTLLAKIDELLAALATAGNTTPEVDAALAALKEQVAIVDGLVPDGE